MQCTQSNTHTKMNLRTVKWAQQDKTQSRELLVCSYVCALHCAQLLHTILHQTDLIIFPLTLQTITIAPMMSIWGKGGTSCIKQTHNHHLQITLCCTLIFFRWPAFASITSKFGRCAFWLFCTVSMEWLNIIHQISPNFQSIQIMPKNLSVYLVTDRGQCTVFPLVL